MAQGDGLIEAGVIKQGGANSASWVNNIAIVNATTTNSNDSIKITSADHSSFVAGFNVGAISLPHQTTAGKNSTLFISSDVTILLTGAHWGQDTLGDLTDAKLYVYAINDSGTRKWGVAPLAHYTEIANTSASATPGDINLQSEMLVNSALSVGTWPCRVVARFHANFDDTGGAAENLWAVQSGVEDIVHDGRIVPVGFRRFSKQKFTSSSTWVKPLGLRAAYVECYAAGGGGGGADGGAGSGSGAGSGGGGGGYANKWITSGLGASETVTIGAAGAAGAASGGGNGGNGGDTSFGSHVVAGGGSGGPGDTAPSTSDATNDIGGAAGAGSTGDDLITGTPGGGSFYLGSGPSALSGFGGRGAGPLGGGGGVGKTGNAAGADGVAPGAGGSGGVVTGSSTDRAGGLGGVGWCIVWEYF